MSDEGRRYGSGEERPGVDLLNNKPYSNNKASATFDEHLADSTTATADGDDSKSKNNSSTSSQMANCLSSTISSIISDLDTQARQTSRSQDQLSSAIDRLTNELDQLLADAPSPFIMHHASKISSVRKRVSSLNSVLKSIQRRVDNIDRLVSAGLPDAGGSPAER